MKAKQYARVGRNFKDESIFLKLPSRTTTSFSKPVEFAMQNSSLFTKSSINL